MEPILDFARQICCMDDVGGRSIIQDLETLILYDIDDWREEHTAAVQQRFPGCTVGVRSCSSSLSGFVVIVRNTPGRGGVYVFMKLIIMVITTYVMVNQIRGSLGSAPPL